MKSETSKATIPMISSRKESKLRTATILIRKDWQLYSLLVLPIIYLIIFKYGPMLGNIIAFRRFVPGGSIFGETWVGLRYFKMFIEDPTFWRVFSNTLMLGGLALLFTFPVPIIFALMLNEVKSKRFKKFVQTASYLPHFLSIVIVAGMILQLTAVNGSINGLVAFLLAITFHSCNVQSGSEPSISLLKSGRVWVGELFYIWQRLTTIDESLYEAKTNRWSESLEANDTCNHSRHFANDCYVTDSKHGELPGCRL